VDLDARLFAAVRKPLHEAQTLPPACYHDPGFYELERTRIFLRMWTPVGRSEEWAHPGDYKAFDRFGVPFVVVRDREGKLRAFANSCRHRGSRITTGEGNCNRLVCPYHSWVYDLDGTLRASPGMEEARDFDRADYRLNDVRLDTWGGFVFVNLSPEGPSLREQLGDIDRHTGSYELENVVTTGRREYVVRANWKTYLENTMEWLHHPTVHRDSIAEKVATIEREVARGDPGEYILIHSLAKGASRAVMGRDKGFPPVSTLKGAAREGSNYALIYPFTMIGCDVDSVWYKSMIPEGPDRVRNVVTFCFHPETVARPDFAEIAPNYYRRFQKVVEEDNTAMQNQFAGLVSPLAVPGRYSGKEVLVHAIDNWVLDRVLDAH